MVLRNRFEFQSFLPIRSKVSQKVIFNLNLSSNSGVNSESGVTSIYGVDKMFQSRSIPKMC